MQSVSARQSCLMGLVALGADHGKCVLCVNAELESLQCTAYRSTADCLVVRVGY